MFIKKKIELMFANLRTPKNLFTGTFGLIEKVLIANYDFIISKKISLSPHKLL